MAEQTLEGDVPLLDSVVQPVGFQRKILGQGEGLPSQTLILVKPNAILIMDVSNIVRDGLHGKLSRLKTMIDHFHSIGVVSIPIADASLRHHVDQPQRYEELLRSGSIVQAPAGMPADIFIDGTAVETSAKGFKPYLVSNDIALSKSGHLAGTIRFMFIPLDGKELLITEPSLETLRRQTRDERL
ncbi:MAG: hypothetical protein ACLQEQ_08200 [Nitrososphaerales archaeon]